MTRQMPSPGCTSRTLRTRLLFVAPPCYRMAAKSIMEYATSCWQLIKNGASPFKTGTSRTSPVSTPGGDAPATLIYYASCATSSKICRRNPFQQAGFSGQAGFGCCLNCRLHPRLPICGMNPSMFSSISLCPSSQRFEPHPGSVCQFRTTDFIIQMVPYAPGFSSPRNCCFCAKKYSPFVRQYLFSLSFIGGAYQNGCAALPAAFYISGANRRRTAM